MEPGPPWQHPACSEHAHPAAHPFRGAADGAAGGQRGGVRPQRRGDNAAQAPLAIDNSPTTDWTTDSYQGSAHFGNLYDGTGLVLDMGKQVTVSSVAVTFGSVPGAHVRIEVGNNNSGTSPAGATTLGHTTNATGPVTFTGHPVTGQFVFIWFTKLASQQGSPGHFQADVFNVVVKGSS